MKPFAWAVLLVLLPLIHGCTALVVGAAATAVMVAHDRRLASVVLQDQEIELLAMKRLHDAFPEKSVSVSAISFNRQLLLVGQVPDEATRKQVAEIVQTIPHVVKVHNETVVASVASYASEVNDAALTTKVKARLVENSKVSANHVKVVTEMAVVYLMGLVTREEGEIAGQVAANTAGVTRVIKLFEYID